MIEFKVLLDFCGIIYSSEQLLKLEKIVNDWIKKLVNKKVKEHISEKINIFTEEPPKVQEAPQKICSDAENVAFALKLMKSEIIASNENNVDETETGNFINENDSVFERTQIKEEKESSILEALNETNVDISDSEIKIEIKYQDELSNTEKEYQSVKDTKTSILQETVHEIQNERSTFELEHHETENKSDFLKPLKDNITETKVDASIFCEVCELAFDNKQIFKSHVIKLHPQIDQNLICDICDQMLASKTKLDLHLILDHKCLEILENKEDNFLCPICDKTFSENDVFDHVKTCEQEAAEMAKGCPKHLKCTLIFDPKKSDTAYQDFKEHITNGHKEYHCEVCQNVIIGKVSDSH